MLMAQDSSDKRLTMPSRLGALIDRVKPPVRNGLIPGSSKSTHNGTLSRKSSSRKSSSSGDFAVPDRRDQGQRRRCRGQEAARQGREACKGRDKKMERERHTQEEHVRSFIFTLGWTDVDVCEYRIETEPETDMD